MEPLDPKDNVEAAQRYGEQIKDEVFLVDGDMCCVAHPTACHLVAVGHSHLEASVWRHLQSNPIDELCGDEVMGGARVDQGHQLDSVDHHGKLHRLGLANPGDGEEGDGGVLVGLLDVVFVWFNLQHKYALAEMLVVWDELLVAVVVKTLAAVPPSRLA